MDDISAIERPTKKQHKATEANGVRFAVNKIGPIFEVRRRTYKMGQLTADQFMGAFDRESDADAVARHLSGVPNE